MPAVDLPAGVGADGFCARLDDGVKRVCETCKPNAFGMKAPEKRIRQRPDRVALLRAQQHVSELLDASRPLATDAQLPAYAAQLFRRNSGAQFGATL